MQYNASVKGLCQKDVKIYCKMVQLDAISQPNLNWGTFGTTLGIRGDIKKIYMTICNEQDNKAHVTYSCPIIRAATKTLSISFQKRRKINNVNTTLKSCKCGVIYRRR